MKLILLVIAVGMLILSGFAYAQDIDAVRKAAERGNAIVQFNLGKMYHNGTGVPKNYEEAVKWYHKAAEQGDAIAQFNLGKMYHNGIGVPKDEKEAIAWYRKSAEQGETIAQNNLGKMYYEGKGVSEDKVQAYVWWNIAASQGVGYAIEQRDFIATRMTLAQIAQAEELASKWKPKKP